MRDTWLLLIHNRHRKARAHSGSQISLGKFTGEVLYEYTYVHYIKNNELIP
jgi:hypothetical protein